MRKKIFFTSSIFAFTLCFVAPLQAGHLDGLWRNDRMQITLRIEEEADGFRAKRTDQGIWYHYTTNDNRRFRDRNGNLYELIDRDEIMWRAANNSKKIHFTKVDDRDYNRRNNGRYGDTYDNSGRDRWNDGRYIDGRKIIEGRWYELHGKDNLKITLFDEGIKVKSKHGSWDKFYQDRTRNRFRDKHGNTLTVIDRDTLRYRSQYGRQERVFTRDHRWKGGDHHWKD